MEKAAQKGSFIEIQFWRNIFNNKKVRAISGNEQQRQTLTYAVQNVAHIEWSGKKIKRFVAVPVV